MSTILDPWEFRTLFVIFKPQPEPPFHEKCEYRRQFIRYFYISLAIISLAYTGFMAYLTRRYNNLRHPKPSLKCHSIDFVRRNFGLAVPVNHLLYRYHPLAYAAAYLCAFNLIGGIFTDTFSMKFDYPNAPTWAGIVFKILAICFMAFTVFPIFLSINYGGTFAWLFGILYCCINMIFLVITIVTGFCGSLKSGNHHLALQLPTLVGYSILSGHLVNNLNKHIQSDQTPFFEPCAPDPTRYVSSVASYVRERIQIPPTLTDSIQTKSRKCCTKFSNYFHETFRQRNGFFYPPALIWSLTVSILLHYLMLNRAMTMTYIYISSGKDYMIKLYPNLNKTFSENLDASNARYVYKAFHLPPNTTQAERYKLEYAFVYYMADLFWLGMIVSCILAFLVNMMNIFKILHSYQRWTFELYQKGFRPFPQFKNLLSPSEITRQTILFPSYQIAMFGCGFHLQVLLYLFLFLFLSVIIGVNAFTPYQFLVNFLKGWWPTFILMFFFNILQTCLIKFVYTQDRARTYGFENIRSLQQFLFFAGFYNVFFGIISGAMRILFCPISSAVSVARMDMSLFPQALQSADKAYVSFLGFIYGDVMQNNPMLRTFVWILCSERIKSGQMTRSYDYIFLSECTCFSKQLKADDTKKFDKVTEQEMSSRKKKTVLPVGLTSSSASTSSVKQTCRARKLWYLAYTLTRNPQLLRYRKHVCQIANEQTTGEA